MKVQEYLKKHGIEKLKEEYSIGVTDYDDRVVLNYNQIDSPRFEAICEECRALILKKNRKWDVLGRSFDRFYNLGEGEGWKDFPIAQARIDEKLDGSLITVYHDDEKWCVATRKMAFAEGKTYIGCTFAELFDKAVTPKFWNFLEHTGTQMCFTFELTSPVNRVVTPYEDTSATLIGCRNRLNGFEVNKKTLDYIAEDMDVARPKSFECNSLDDIKEKANSLATMDEGFVLVYEQDGSFRRLKCKNDKYLAIAHLRDNGIVNPKRIMTLVVDNEQHEYLQYFESDRKYFDFAEAIYLESIINIEKLWKESKNIESQKDFALFIIPRCIHGYEKGILFDMRKGEPDIRKLLRGMGGKRLAEDLDLKAHFIKEFKEFSVLDK